MSCVIIPGIKKLKQWKSYTDLMRLVIFFWQTFGLSSQEPRLRLV
ncbi:hypothetical protein HanIR_Chr16g0824091 [Helianthus annuus]|nr:hypothetical protein HanIR_Chr16g0824091 [Helianthus annuus]